MLCLVFKDSILMHFIFSGLDEWIELFYLTSFSSANMYLDIWFTYFLIKSWAYFHEKVRIIVWIVVLNIPNQFYILSGMLLAPYSALCHLWAHAARCCHLCSLPTITAAVCGLLFHMFFRDRMVTGVRKELWFQRVDKWTMESQTWNHPWEPLKSGES